MDRECQAFYIVSNTLNVLDDVFPSLPPPKLSQSSTDGSVVDIAEEMIGEALDNADVE